MINNSFFIRILEDDFYCFIKLLYCFDENYNELNKKKNS